MTVGKNDDPAPAALSATTIDLAIRLGFLGLLGYWSLKVIAPFLTIVLWSGILTVALHPLFDWLARWLGSRRLAAVLVTLLCFMIVVGPLTWLGVGLVGGLGSLVKALDAGQLSIPPPAESLKSWPLIGEHLHRVWTLRRRQHEGNPGRGRAAPQTGRP